MYRKILLINEGSIEANGALEPSLSLSRRFDAELHMLLVEQLPRFPTTMTEISAEKAMINQRLAFIVSAAQQRAREAQVKFRSHIVVGRFVERITEFVSEQAIDLLVLSARNRSGLRQRLRGTPLDRVIWSVPCAVYIVKAAEDGR